MSQTRIVYSDNNMNIHVLHHKSNIVWYVANLYINVRNTEFVINIYRGHL